jgi:septation ring formation regulator EzrA
MRSKIEIDTFKVKPNRYYLSDLESRETQYPELQTTYEGKTVRLKHLHDREQRLNERVRELRRQHEENKQNEESYRSNNKIVDRMMEAKRSGEIPGILGRLVGYTLMIKSYKY